MSRPDAPVAPHRACAAILAACLGLGLAAQAAAWGDEGHEIVALIAAQAMHPHTLAAVDALLCTDRSGLVAGCDIASESVWADRYRSAHPETRDWHYVDNEIRGAPVANPGELLERIAQLRDTLADPSAAPAERLFALQFLLHLVGDLHQPLHAADDHDRGGNAVRVALEGFAPGSLHQYWDSVFVGRLGENAQQVARRLFADVDAGTRAAAAHGTPADWAQESFGLAASKVYGRLPPADAHGVHVLDAGYANAAGVIVARQLQLAGLRLASILDQALR